jgi:mediator of RNA polymerase II transcription subunit 12, fungi type
MVPPVLPEILHLANDTSLEAPSSLANALWYNYRTASDWGWVVWDNTVASLRRVPLMTSDVTGRRTRALLYGNFLLHVDEHLPNGLNDQVLKWFLGNGKSEAAVLDADTWEVLTVVLLFLALRGALATTTILQGLIYPAWHLAANTTAENVGNTPEVFLTAANNLANQLLVQWDESASYVPQADLLDEQRIRTRQQDQYREPHFLTLLSNILTLVRIENNSYISETLRVSSRSIRQDLGRNADFHRAVNQNLEAVRNSFEQAMPGEGADQQGTDCIIEALRTIWWRLPNGALVTYCIFPAFQALIHSAGESAAVDLENWSDLPSLLSPWKLASTAIQLQFILRRLERALSDETTSQAADSSIDKLTTTVFHHPLSWEEARFMAEIVSGIGVSIAAKVLELLLDK